MVAAYQEVTREWWQSAPGRFHLVASALVVSEARAGDADAARARLEELESLVLLDATSEAEALAAQLLDSGAVPSTAAEDAAHIAIATTNGVDYLVTWNFRHIAHASMRSRIERVCRQAGYAPPVICAPTGYWSSIMDTIQPDPIIAELRAVRDTNAARFNCDAKAIFQDIRAMQETSGREYVRYPARRVDELRDEAPEALTP